MALWIKDGRVTVNGAPGRASTSLRPGSTVEVDEPPEIVIDLLAESLPFEVVYQDDDLVVVDKPAGLVVHPGAGHAQGTLVNGLLGRVGSLSPVGAPTRPGIVHRIDRGTSGLLVVARTEAAHHHLARQFSRHEVSRRYWALVWDRHLPDSGTVETAYGRHPTDRMKFTGRGGARHAITHFSVERRLPPCAVVECRLDTGRTHQIRVHLSELGAPLLGDALYGQRRQVERPVELRRLGFDLGLTRQALHARHLGFIHPRTGLPMNFDSPLPPELVAVLEALERVCSA